MTTYLLAALFGWWYLRFGGDTAVNILLKGNRATIYSTATSVFGSLLGFVITATSIVLAVSDSDRLQVVRDSAQYPMLWRVFTATIHALSAATLASFAALIFDRDECPIRSVFLVALVCFVLSCTRMARAIWAFKNVLLLITMRLDVPEARGRNQR
ncbi:MAG: hypothetical protein JO047_16630 [Alphaproteobacteria bacterium]|nr:hypothetical protein [Alphaproteobacteria bacterium]